MDDAVRRLILVLITAVLLLTGCTTDYIYRDFSSEAVRHERLKPQRHNYYVSRIHFANGQFMDDQSSKYRWVEFKKYYEGRCFQVTTRQAIGTGGPDSTRGIVEIEEIDCSGATETVKTERTWVEECEQ